MKNGRKGSTCECKYFAETQPIKWIIQH